MTCLKTQGIVLQSDRDPQELLPLYAHALPRVDLQRDDLILTGCPHQAGYLEPDTFLHKPTNFRRLERSENEKSRHYRLRVGARG